MAGSRRGFLKVMGAGGVILAAGAGGWALTRDPAQARAPWRMAGSERYPDPMRRALSCAILAPNPHNMQPWRVALHSDREATLYGDLDRLLPATDPMSRQIVIGLGAFLETLALAAAQEGLAAQIAAFPDGADDASLDARPVAHIRLVDDTDVRPDPLFAAVLDRRTDRTPYDLNKPVREEALAAIAAAGAAGGVASRCLADAGLVETLRDLTWRAWAIEVETPRALQESIDVMRIGRREIETAPDGLMLAGPLMEALSIAGVLTRAKMADPASVAFAQTRDFQKPLIETAMAYATIVTEGNARLDQIAAGRAYMRQNLAATAQGVCMQPLSQALQEYPEMAGPYAEAHALLAPEGGTVQMLARLGYGKGAKPAPRWPLEAKLTPR